MYNGLQTLQSQISSSLDLLQADKASVVLLIFILDDILSYLNRANGDCRLYMTTETVPNSI